MLTCFEVKLVAVKIRNISLLFEPEAPANTFDCNEVV